MCWGSTASTRCRHYLRQRRQSEGRTGQVSNHQPGSSIYNVISYIVCCPIYIVYPRPSSNHRKTSEIQIKDVQLSRKQKKGSEIVSPSQRWRTSLHSQKKTLCCCFAAFPSWYEMSPPLGPQYAKRYRPIE